MEEKNSNVNSPDNGNNGQYDNQYTDPGNMQFTNPENMQFTNPENMQYTDPENIQFTNPENMQQGYVPYNYAQGPEVPEPKRNNKKLGIIIGSVIGAVAVIAIICAVLLPKLLISDKATGSVRRWQVWEQIWFPEIRHRVFSEASGAARNVCQIQGGIYGRPPQSGAG